MLSTDNLLQTLDLLAATPGKKDKQAIVANFTLDERGLLKLALDPTVTYFVAKLAAPTTTGTAEWDVAEFELLANLSSRKLTGNEALQQIDFSLRELSPASGELLRRVILKDLRCGVGTTIMNKAFPGLIPDFPYMRCTLPKDSNFEKFNWAGGIYSQLKANGMFARIDHDDEGKVLVTSRQGNTFPAGALIHIERSVRSAFHRGTQTHGELTVHIDGVLQTRAIGNGILNSALSSGDLPPNADVRFDAWDQIPLAEAVVGGKICVPYGQRLAHLHLQLQQHRYSVLHLVETELVYSKAEAMTHYRAQLAKGLEGTVCKSPDAIWKDGDSKDQVKFKLQIDVDLEIVGFREGTEGKRTSETFGSLICQTSDGMLEVAVSGFKREMEQYLHENRSSVLHKIVCVAANEVSKPSESNALHSLFHPRFVELRPEKAQADSLPQVVAQFEAACAG